MLILSRKNTNVQMGNFTVAEMFGSSYVVERYRKIGQQNVFTRSLEGRLVDPSPL